MFFVNNLDGRGWRNVRDELGNVYGRLTVTSFAEIRSKEGTTRTRTLAYWNVECTCGKKKAVSGKDLRQGHAVSCGCWKREWGGRLGRSRKGITPLTKGRPWSDKRRAAQERKRFASQLATGE